jgi:N-acetyl-anhydromuramyl-L-alanine amidase AmpD
VITQRRIGFPSSRKRQMAAYSQRHYGEATWRLRPRGIVQHYTGSGSLAGVMATFAANSPDPELGERPGVCAHFVIDTDGSVYQVVSLRIRCRHTVGLNHRMIGVEHVGTSDAAVMSNGRQRVASLRLSAWLVARFGLSTADVIGHNENVRSTLHRERYRPWRCQTHGDFARSTMRDYRARLVRRVAAVGGDTTAPQWRGNRCGR